MDVVYEGIRLTPARIAAAAVQEGVHVVGLSILSGSHAELIPSVLDELKAAGADVPVVVGGIIPAADEKKLLDAGVARVYTPKDFEVSRIMGDIVDLVAERHAVRAVTRVAPRDRPPGTIGRGRRVDRNVGHGDGSRQRAKRCGDRRARGAPARGVASRSSDGSAWRQRVPVPRGRRALHRVHRGVFAVGRPGLAARASRPSAARARTSGPRSRSRAAARRSSTHCCSRASLRQASIRPGSTPSRTAQPGSVSCRQSLKRQLAASSSMSEWVSPAPSQSPTSRTPGVSSSRAPPAAGSGRG